MVSVETGLPEVRPGLCGRGTGRGVRVLRAYVASGHQLHVEDPGRRVLCDVWKRYRRQLVLRLPGVLPTFFLNDFLHGLNYTGDKTSNISTRKVFREVLDTMYIKPNYLPYQWYEAVLFCLNRGPIQFSS